MTDTPTQPPLPETTPLLAERARAGFVLVMGAVGAFAIADLAVNHHVIGPLLAIAGVQVAAAALGHFVLRGTPSWRRATMVPIAVLAVVFGTGALSDVLSHNLHATSTMCVLGCLVTGTLFPWGARPQAVAAAAMTAAGITALAVIEGSLASVAHL